MTITELLNTLGRGGIRLRRDGGELVVSGKTQALGPEVVGALRAHKPALLEMVSEGEWWSPPVRITPEMLSLVELTQAEIDGIAARVEGGARNIQDIYPLAPLQEGILFHHLLAGDDDPYLLPLLFEFETRERVEDYFTALQRVIDRHDILRTSMMWEGLREPVQVVWREARVAVEEVELDPGGGEAREQLWARFGPRRHRMNVQRAPLLHGYVARDAARGGWVLLLVRHHLSGDHTTTDILRSEVRAYMDGREAELPEPLPFRNFVAQTRLGIPREEHERFFRELLGDVTESTAPFGLMDVRGGAQGVRVSRLTFEGEPARRLREAARRLGTTPVSVCHLAWALVLAHASGRDDVVFGTVLFGRMQGGEGAHRVMGPCINTLPVRIRVGGEGVEATVRRTHALLADLLRHEHAPLALAQRSSGVDASTPLFTALMNYRHSGGAARPPGARLGRDGMQMVRAEDRTNYPLTLSVDDRGEGFILTVKVQADAPVDPARACAMVHRALEGLLEALETAPGRPVRSVAVLPEEERRRLVEEWNTTDAGFPRDACLHELFERRVERTPDAVALVHGDRVVSYAELNRRANRLAHHLKGLGVGPEVRVGISVERSLEMVCAVLAVLKAGGAYVPLDPYYPADRLAYMVEDSAPAVLLTRAALAERLAGTGLPRIALDADAHRWAGEPATNPERGVLGPRNLAYTIYTSGSTGRPKGVMIPHGNAVNRMSWMQAVHGIAPLESFLQNSSFSFDASVFELLWPMNAGARVVLVPPEMQRDPGRLLELIQDERLTRLFFVASMLQLVLETPGVERCTSVVRVISGGEALSPAVVRRFHERLPGVALYNMYGPAESAASVTGRVAVADEAPRVTVGRPVANVRLYLLGKDGEPVPEGVVGEVCMAGAQLARGYLNRPGPTAERFLPDPFGHEPGGRLYRTGDLGRRLPDGTLELVGRNDDQVKVRGFRVEPGEVEARLVEHAAVREAVVAVREDRTGDRRLVAYYVGGEALDAQALRAHLAERVPEHMLPAAYVRLEALPLTPSGKVDRRALPAPEGDAYARGRYDAPVGETETALATIWAEVLGVERVGRGDSFFELGGHSLLAVRATARVREALDPGVVLADLFAHPTVESFAARVCGSAPALAVDRAVQVRAGGSQRPLFLAHEGTGSVAYAQLLLPHLDPDVPLYALPAAPASAPPLRTVEGMAARLVRMIREVQPAGPYRLAGWSFGGTLAYEVATQLLGLDERVEFLGLIDSHYPGGRGGIPADPRGGYPLLLHMLRMETGAGGGAPRPEVQAIAASAPDLESFVAQCREKGLLPAEVTVAHAREMQDRLHANRRSVGEYSPVPIPVPVHLFSARDGAGDDPRRGWQALLPAASLRVASVPGTHLSMMAAPNIASLGEALSQALGRGAAEPQARAAGPASPLVVLRTGQRGVAPLVCLPGAGSSVVTFIELAGRLDPAWPVLGLEPRGLEGDAVPHSSVEAAAESCLGALRAACPQGSVHLLGHSFGGWVAFEMALRLRAAGRPPASLTLLDSEPPDDDESPIRETGGAEAFLKLVEIMELSAERSFAIAPAEVAALDQEGRLKLLHERMVRYGLGSARATPEVLRGPFRTFGRALRTAYRPSAAYPDRLHLVLLGDDRQDESANRAYFERTVAGWRRRAPGLVVSTGAGNHVTALKPPHVGTLATILAAERAGAGRSGETKPGLVHAG